MVRGMSLTGRNGVRCARRDSTRIAKKIDGLSRTGSMPADVTFL